MERVMMEDVRYSAIISGCLCIARCEESGYMDCYNTEPCRDQALHSANPLLLVQLIAFKSACGVSRRKEKWSGALYQKKYSLYLPNA